MRKTAFFFLLALLTLVGAYVSWRSKAPSWQGQNLNVEVTAPPQFDLLFVGDTGSGSESQFQVAQAMEKICRSSQVIAVFLLGDNFYTRGVGSTQDPQWQSKFQDMYSGSCLKKLPFYAILGNHDYIENPSAQIAYHGNSPSWNMPHRFYRVSFGKSLQIVATDSNIFDVCGSANHCTQDFLRESLLDSQSPTIVLAHHPLKSSSKKYNQESLQARLFRKYLCGHKVIFMAGHSHHLEHRRDSECQIDEVINGGGGASLYELGPADSQVKFARSSHGFIHLRYQQTHLTFTFFNEKAESIYQFQNPDKR